MRQKAFPLQFLSFFFEKSKKMMILLFAEVWKENLFRHLLLSGTGWTKK